MNYLIDNEKCPECGEGWEQGKGLDCANNCEDKKLEEKHRAVAQPMVNYCLLPEYQTWVDCPNGLTEEEINREGWGWTDDLAKKITIPWLTLRNKEEFFDTVPHETSHISAYQHKFSSSEKNTVENYYRDLEEYENLPLLTKYSQAGKNYKTMLDNYYQKHKELFEEYDSQGGHWYNPAYLQYCRYFKKLSKSSYAKYAYGLQRYPRSYEEYSQ